MNKSTPIHQLPVGNGSGPGFINEQQKQMITQAQQAIGNMNLPQNTQIADIATEDDATIQEVLNQINGGGSTAPSVATQQQQIPAQLLQQQAIQQEIQQQQAYALQQQQAYANQLQQQLEMSAMYNMQPQSVNMAAPASTGIASTLDQFFGMFADDLKLVVFVLGAAIIAQFVPLSTFLGKYIAIDKIPHHDVFVKAILTASLVLFAKRAMLK